MDFDTLMKEFKDIMEHEKRAKFFYDHYIDQIDSSDIRGELQSIRDDEIMHIKIAEELIQCVEDMKDLSMNIRSEDPS